MRKKKEEKKNRSTDTKKSKKERNLLRVRSEMGCQNECGIIYIVESLATRKGRCHVAE